ncbi:MAG: arylsulfotransferase family protein, partial [Thiohalobacterales bacterium]|nr:arylsulfotransferase family protein [Thiohalobacterales bacterium]
LRSRAAMNTIQKIAAAFLCVVAAAAIFVYGIAVGDFKLAPYPLFREAYKEYEKIQSQMGKMAVKMNVETDQLPIYYKKKRPDRPQDFDRAGESFPGINLVTRIAKGPEIAVEMIDMEGNVVHSWDVDWFDVWPDADHLPEFLKPKSRPGTHIHGAVVLENGALVFNYEHIGLVKLARDSAVEWRLPYRTHHSIHRHDDGMLWVSGQKLSTEPDPLFPGRKAPFDKYTILEIDPDKGQILNEWMVADILHDNGYANLLHLVPTKTRGLSQVADDRLHLNDVEPFPEGMAEGFFTKGDVLVSLRNISTVFVFNKDTGKIKYITTGVFSQQHDPDFIDGNRFSVFDNNTRKPKAGVLLSSRIVIMTAPGSDIEVVYEGTRENKFYTPIMGKHQWLPNGNILITESVFGRAFEVNAGGQIVWQYVNDISEELVALVEEVSRYPLAHGGFQAPRGSAAHAQ